ncbi:hypothetical protein [uncultured Sphingomonas sp.]|uniref:hypothetical protein n=1 Tax=uncultured Sphingomonas sp. TaxID=158754 RepID=UPI0025F29C57|nr:hypothetical protein [uncultured Sphingomonas sp.]
MAAGALLLLSAGLSAAAADVTVTAPRGAPWTVRVPDTVLATMRGGVRLPNGLDLSLGIDIQTWIDGQLALRTVYASDGSQPGVRVFTGGAMPAPTVPPTATLSSGGEAGVPLLIVDRSPTGPTIVPTGAVGAATVNIVDGDPAIWLGGGDQTPVPVTPNGPAVAAPPGDLRFTIDADGAAVTLRTPTLEVRQLVGQATGVIVANSGNNTAIDTVSAVNVDLGGLSPALLASTFAAQRAALEAFVVR